MVITDADMLFGGTTRGLFINLDYLGAVRLHWSQRILDEMSKALVNQGRKPDADSAKVHEQRMNESLPNAMVPTLEVDACSALMAAYVKDPDDAHVAACAYAVLKGDYYPPGQVVVLATRNLPDYDIPKLGGAGITVLHPDAFLMTLPPAQVAEAFRALRTSLQLGPSPETLLKRLKLDGTTQTAQMLQAGAFGGLFEL